jgi:hypothetical protein
MLPTWATTLPPPWSVTTQGCTLPSHPTLAPGRAAFPSRLVVRLRRVRYATGLGAPAHVPLPPPLAKVHL